MRGAVPMPSSPSPAEAATSVVLVDDSEDLRFLLRVELERNGDFRVLAEAADGEEGVAAVRESKPDVVLLDILMPVMDGMQALELIRKEFPDTIVVMLSALGDASGMPQRAMGMGAAGYIRKGGHVRALPEQLRVLVGSVIAERAARQRAKVRPVQ